MDINLRQIDDVFESSVREIMEHISSKVSTKAVRHACTNFINQQEEILSLKKELQACRHELVDVKQTLKQVKGCMIFLTSLP